MGLIKLGYKYLDKGDSQSQHIYIYMYTLVTFLHNSHEPARRLLLVSRQGLGGFLHGLLD